MNLALIDDYALLLKYLSRAGYIEYCRKCTLYMTSDMKFSIKTYGTMREITMSAKYVELVISSLKVYPAKRMDVYRNRWEETKDIVSCFDRKVVCLNGSLS